MTAKQLYVLIIGLFVGGFLQGVLDGLWPPFPLEVVFSFQGLVLGSGIASKLINDTKEMKYGIMAEKPCEEPK